MRLIDVLKRDRSERDAGSDFGGMDGARGFRMIGYFFGDGFRELGTKMPEKRAAARAEQAQEPIGDENDAADFEESFENQVLFHEDSAPRAPGYRLFVIS